MPPPGVSATPSAFRSAIGWYVLSASLFSGESKYDPVADVVVADDADEDDEDDNVDADAASGSVVLSAAMLRDVAVGCGSLDCASANAESIAADGEHTCAPFSALTLTLFSSFASFFALPVSSVATLSIHARN